MEKNVSHRSSSDEKWQQLKKDCRIRDNGLCRCCSILTPQELYERNKLNLPNYLFIPCDVAHIESVGSHVEKTYELSNVVYMCRYCHEMMDSYKSVATGRPISKEEHDNWWQRIIKGRESNTFDVKTILDETPKRERFDPEKWLDS